MASLKEKWGAYYFEVKPVDYFKEISVDYFKEINDGLCLLPFQAWVGPS